jgi:hypothetical protein
MHPEAQPYFSLSFFMLIFIFSLLFVTVGYISDKALTEATSFEKPNLKKHHLAYFMEPTSSRSSRINAIPDSMRHISSFCFFLRPLSDDMIESIDT